MKASEKAVKIREISDDLKYLKEELDGITLWGRAPDGDVPFETLVDWLSDENVIYNVEHLIKVIKDMESIK